MRVSADRADVLLPRPSTVPQHVNETFAQYVQATAFSLSLGRTHVVGLAHVLSNDPVWCGADLTLQALNGLQRRGLIRHERGWRLTTAGELVVRLLVEAGIFPPDALTRLRSQTQRGDTDD